MVENRSLGSIPKLIICLVACLAAGGIGSIFTSPAIGNWYVTLPKPPFTPPNWLFAPAWTTLYILMGISVYFIWRHGLQARGVFGALVIFAIQLILNILWSVVFFGLHSLVGGVIVIVLLWITILITIIKFFPISFKAGVLLIPYILWVSFASALNIAVWLLN